MFSFFHISCLIIIQVYSNAFLLNDADGSKNIWNILTKWNEMNDIFFEFIVHLFFRLFSAFFRWNWHFALSLFFTLFRHLVHANATHVIPFGKKFIEHDLAWFLFPFTIVILLAASKCATNNLSGCRKVCGFYWMFTFFSWLRTDQMLNTGRISIHVRRAKDHYFVIQTNANPWHRKEISFGRECLTLPNWKWDLFKQFYDVFLLATHFFDKRKK